VSYLNKLVKYYWEGVCLNLPKFTTPIGSNGFIVKYIPPKYKELNG